MFATLVEKLGPMNSALSRELSLVAGLMAVATRKSERWSTAFSLLSAGLLIASVPREFDLVGKNVVITGGSRGLGLSLAWNLLERGAAVTLIARDLDELEAGRDHLLNDFTTASVWTIACDVTKRGELGTSLKFAIQNMGSVDLLINNAGAILVGPLTSMKREDFEAQMNLHLFAALGQGANSELRRHGWIIS